MIKFLDLFSQYKTIKKEIDEAINRVISNSSYIGGDEVVDFEKNFAKYQNSNFCISVANGTDALEIFIEALNMPKGSEVIVPANSFIATSEAVTRQGLNVVFADVDSQSYTLNPLDVYRHITKNTSAIIAVHLYGHPCKMDALKKISIDYGLKLIEDCAQAHGAEYENKRLGTIGDGGTFSFYPGKNLGAYGDAGAIITNDSIIEKRCRMIANHGRVGKYDHEFEGRNSRMDGIQAAILNVKLKYLDHWIEKRNIIAREYFSHLCNVNQIKLPTISKSCRHAFHLFVIRAEKRDELKQYLNEIGIQTGIHYPVALPMLHAYKYLKTSDYNMFAVESGKYLLSLPIGDHLTVDEVRRVSDAIKEFYM